MQKSAELNIKMDSKETKKGQTPFHFACIDGRSKIVEMFLKRSMELDIDLNSKDQSGMTGFHMACVYGKTSIVEMIIDNADSSNIDLKAKTWARKTAFQIATDGVKKLIKKKMPMIAM